MSGSTNGMDGSPRGLSRRRFVGLALGFAGSLALAGPAEASSFFLRTFVRRPASANGWEPPSEWIETMGADVARYGEFLERLGLRHITVEQIIEPHLKKRGKVRNSIPPRSMWKAIRPTLKAADALAHELGEPVKEVVSAYRSPAYNALCPGAMPNSYHLRNMALDLQFRSSPRRVAMVARELREKGYFMGGVGRYGSFTHIDTRGSKADW